MHGVGSEKVGGRWSKKGRAVIYTSLDPSTTILEVAVHMGFKSLDVIPHKILSIEILKTAAIKVVIHADIPNPRWLTSGSISASQQDFGSDLLDQHPILLIPSAVSAYSWNLLIDVARAKGMFKLKKDNPFVLDTRLNPIS